MQGEGEWVGTMQYLHVYVVQQSLNFHTYKYVQCVHNWTLL